MAKPALDAPVQSTTFQTPCCGREMVAMFMVAENGEIWGGGEGGCFECKRSYDCAVVRDGDGYRVSITNERPMSAFDQLF